MSWIKDETGATSIVFDGLDMLLSGLRDEQLERQELLRLDGWIRGANMSGILTVKHFGTAPRDGMRTAFLHYMTDCVGSLSGNVTETSASRTPRIAKYRGTDRVSSGVGRLGGGYPRGSGILSGDDAPKDGAGRPALKRAPK